jgi:uncharacterized repeat protein (TIGR03803 family)
VKIKMPLLFALTSSFILALNFNTAAQAQTYNESVIYSFGGASGTEPLFSGVVRDDAGNFYGTTYAGGTYNYGTVFKVDSSGKETVLHNFGEGFDGRTPLAGLVRDASGHLFGTTSEGGVRNSFCHKGCGIVFEVDESGNAKILHSFTAGADGANPFGGLIRDAAGNLYGTTQMGGPYNYGTVFKVDHNGVESVLYAFGAPPDGEDPEAGVIRDAAGNLYGTTAGGGAFGSGSVFELDASGRETVLYSFTGRSDGFAPTAPLFRTSNGDLYGTTFLGGAGIGTVFKVDVHGNEKTLHTFDGTTGAYPEGALVSDSQGNLYGTTIQGGPGGIAGGVIFKITPQGVFTAIYGFPGQPGGGNPDGPLLLDSSGTFYGTTSGGGAANSGTVFKLTP